MAFDDSTDPEARIRKPRRVIARRTTLPRRDVAAAAETQLPGFHSEFSPPTRGQIRGTESLS